MQVEPMTAEGPCDEVLERALAHANDCAVHGRDLEALERHLGEVHAAYERAERGRAALLAFVHETEEAIRLHEHGLMRPGLTMADVMAALAKGVGKAHTTHDQAVRP